MKSLHLSDSPEPVAPVIIADIPVSPLSTRQWVQLMLDDCREAREGRATTRYHAAINGNVISAYARNRVFRDAYRHADAVAADGVPVLWAARLIAGREIPDRAATTDLFHDLAAAAQDHGYSMYFLGATDEENARAVARVRQLYPRLVIAGARNGYFSAEEEDAVVQQILDARPDILWVALGMPREDVFVARNLHRFGGIAWVKTCGGLFNFLSASRPRAPMWMQRAGLEWLYRMALEPRRLFWRYLTTNLDAIWQILRKTPRRQG